MSRRRRVFLLIMAAGSIAAAWPLTATAQMFPYFRPGRRAATIMGGPLGPAPLDPYSVSAFWGFLPSPIVARQAIGHQIIWTGPNGYVYRPVYADEDPSGVAQSDGFKVMPRASSAVSEPVAAPPAAPAAKLPLAPAGPQDAVGKAKLLFRLGRYEDSLAALEQAPEDQAAEADLLAAQVLFALADYPTAVEALRRATETLPETEWGRYIADYRSYFPSALRYAVHLRSLERSTEQFPEQAEAKLLLAYHYGSLGFADQAIALLAELKPNLLVDRPLVDRLREHFNRQRAAPAPDDDVRGPALVPPGPLAERPAKTVRPGPREF